MEHLLLQIRRFVQTKVILAQQRISLGLMINKGMLLAFSRKLFFGVPLIALGLTGMSLSAVK